MNEAKCKCGDGDQEFWDKVFFMALENALNKQSLFGITAVSLAEDTANDALAERNKRMGDRKDAA